MNKEIKDYLHLYLGCKCMVRNYYSKEFRKDRITIQLLLDWYLSGGGFAYNPEEIKPILRPLSDMSEEEKKFANLYDYKVKGIEDSIEHWSDLINSLRKKEFDCDGLIEARLAIDRCMQENKKV